MKNIDWIKVAGAACTILSVLASVASAIVDDKKLDIKVDEKLQQKLTEMNK